MWNRIFSFLQRLWDQCNGDIFKPNVKPVVNRTWNLLSTGCETGSKPDCSTIGASPTISLRMQNISWRMRRKFPTGALSTISSHMRETLLRTCKKGYIRGESLDGQPHFHFSCQKVYMPNSCSSISTL